MNEPKPKRQRVEPIYRRLGKLIAERRNELGLRQVTLAKKLGISRPSLANIEKGGQRILLHQVFKIEKTLGYPSGYLIAKGTR